MKAQQELFEGSQMSRAEAVQLTEMYLKDYFDRYSHVAIAFSGGKDSTALVSVVINAIESGYPAETENIGQLNPALSRWLMGLPPEWDLAAISAYRMLKTRRKHE